MSTWSRTDLRNHWPVAILIACGLAAVLVLLGRFFTSAQPTYAGKPLSFWLEQLDSPDAGQAQVAIRAIGPKAIPFLFQAVREASSTPNRFYRTIWSKLPSPVARRLSLPHGTPRERARIVAALRLLETKGIPAVTKALDDSDSAVRRVAITALASIGPQASSAVPHLIERATDPDPEVRAAAILAFRYMGPDRAQAVPVLTQALRDNALVHPESMPPAPISALAVQVLGKVGPAAVSALPELARSLSDTNNRTRQQVILAMWRIDHDTNLVQRALQELDRATDAQTCKSVLDILGEMGRAARPAIATILRLTTNAPAPMKSAVPPIPAAARATLRKIAPELVERPPGPHLKTR
jgi:HEAT repeat protein